MRDLKKMQNAVRTILVGIGEDPEREGLKATPERVQRMYVSFLASAHAYKKLFGQNQFFRHTITRSFTANFINPLPNLKLYLRQIADSLYYRPVIDIGVADNFRRQNNFLCVA